MLKPKITKRKFYDKWDYKVSLRSTAAVAFRNFPLDVIVDVTNGVECGVWRIKRYRDRIANNADFCRQLAVFLQQNQGQYQLRLEHLTLDVYVNSSDLYNQLCHDFSKYLVHRYEPDPTKFSTVDGKIVSEKLPHDKFHFKVFLKPHKMAGDREGKQRYIDWLETQGSKVLITESVKSWFVKTDWNWDRRYMWVEDDQTLLLLKLRGADVIGKVYEYAVADK
jgi:hypothetical protein